MGSNPSRATMNKIPLIDILDELTTILEERVLDQNCADNKMKWDDYIKKILSGWNPDNFQHEYWLDVYRNAIQKLKKSGKRKDEIYH